MASPADNSGAAGAKRPDHMHIGEVAEHTGLSLRTIRHYEEMGLAPPSGRTSGGFRLYSPRDVERLLLIKRMKPLGYSLDEMRELLTLVDSLDSGAGVDRSVLLERLVQCRDEVATRLAQLRAMVRYAEEFLDRLDHEVVRREPAAIGDAKPGALMPE